MKKITSLQLMFVIVILCIAAFLSAGQAIALAWLSSFPERVTQLKSLEIKFWSNAVLSVSLFLVDVILVVRLLRQPSEQISSGMRPGNTRQSGTD